ncbi:MAG: tetratricopeptide repeat protein, partial [Thermodesulfovibrionales bacterium]
KDKKYLSWLTFFLALMSKEAAIMLPFTLIILSTDKKGFKKGLIAITPYIILVGIYVVMRAMFTDTVLGDNVNKPLFTRLITMAVAAFDYIKLFLIPYPLSPFYSAKWYTSIFEPKVLLAIVSFILITFHAVTLRNDRAMLFLLLFPLSMLVPVIFRVNTFPVGLESVYIAERFLYVPVMLFSLLISAYAVRLAGEKSKKHLIIGWALIIAIFTGITVSSNTTWKNNIALYTKIIQASPDAAFAHNNLGNAYYAKGLKNEAFKEYKTAVKLKPYDIVFHQNLGEFYYLEGELNKAVQEFNAALKPMPNAHKFDNVHSKQGALNQADINKTFWEYQPCFANTHFYLGRVYLAQGNIDKATRKFKVATILKPDFVEAHYNLGNVYRKQGKLDDAVKEYQTVLKLNANHADARNNLESLYIKTKNKLGIIP